MSAVLVMKLVGNIKKCHVITNSFGPFDISVKLKQLKGTVMYYNVFYAYHQLTSWNLVWLYHLSI